MFLYTVTYVMYEYSYSTGVYIPLYYEGLLNQLCQANAQLNYDVHACPNDGSPILSVQALYKSKI